MTYTAIISKYPACLLDAAMALAKYFNV